MEVKSNVLAQINLPLLLWSHNSYSKGHIEIVERDGLFYWIHPNYNTTSNRMAGGWRTIVECFSSLVSYMQEDIIRLTTIAQKHHTLTEALRESLKTPWNNV